MILVINAIIVALFVLMSVVVGMSPDFRGLVEKDVQMMLYSNAHLKAVRDGQLAIRAGQLPPWAGSGTATKLTSSETIDTIDESGVANMQADVILCSCSAAAKANFNNPPNPPASSDKGLCLEVCNANLGKAQVIAVRNEIVH